MIGQQLYAEHFFPKWASMYCLSLIAKANAWYSTSNKASRNNRTDVDRFAWESHGWISSSYYRSSRTSYVRLTRSAGAGWGTKQFGHEVSLVRGTEAASLRQAEKVETSILASYFRLA
jgi:hypothetical protein